MRRLEAFLAACITTWLIFNLVCWACGQALGAEVPTAALPYQRTLTREARAVWGLNAPIAVIAGQVQQESAWKPAVCSAFACGLAQFTPQTADWISGAYPHDLGANQPLSPAWALRAVVRYDYVLYEPLAWAWSDCDRWAFALSGYNGGPGWLERDRKLCSSFSACDPDRWWSNVELHTRRSPAAAKENRGYPRHILLSYQAVYVSWQGAVQCSLPN